MERGTYVDACCAAFPSVTPVCAATIATGARQDRHRIPSMNWYSRDERRYVEYGSSFSASRRFGITRQLTDTIYNMNAEHLPADVPTVFETLDDAGVRTAGTTYLYLPRPPRARGLARDGADAAGLDRHAPARDGARASSSTPTSSPAARPAAARSSACRASATSTPAASARTSSSTTSSTSCCSRCPTTTPTRTSNGPHAQVTSIAAADRQLERLFHAGGGTDAFLDEHAVIVVADHSHAPVERRIDLDGAFDDWHVLAPERRRPSTTPRSRCARRSARRWSTRCCAEGREALVPRIVDTALRLDGVDLVMWRPAPREGAIRGAAGELRFAPGGDVRDERGERWSRRRRRSRVLDARVSDGVLRTADYPDALARVWAALTCETSGDVLLSAAPGWEFPDWGGVDHVGGGSHGSLHRSDSLGALAFCGVEPPGGQAPRRGRSPTSRRWSAAISRPPEYSGPRMLGDAAKRCAAVVAAALAVLAVSATPSSAQSAKSAPSTPSATSTTQTDPNKAVPVPDMDAVPAGRRLTGTQVQRIAERNPVLLRAERRHPGSYPNVFTKGPARWQVSLFTRDKPAKEIAQVLRRRRDRARSSRRGPASRWPGRWRAATPARSGARSTRRGSGSR